MEIKKTVCYEDFGAVGDGKTDDYDAIRAAHEYANEHGLDVVTDGTKTYYINDTGLDEKTRKPSVIIKTNVDWNSSNFIIDDSNITVNMPARSMYLFMVPALHEAVSYTVENDTPNGAIAKINAAGGFKADTLNFDIGIGYEALVFVRNDNKKVYIRYGANRNDGGAQEELIYIDKDGNIDPDTRFLLDYDAVTRITVFRADDPPLTIKGGIFTNIANQAMEDYKYYCRSICIRRSNTVVDGITYKITGEGEHGDPYAAFIDVQNANNVVIQNSTFQAHKYYMCVGSGGGEPVGMGTYAISAHDSNKVTWKNCTQSNFYSADGKWRTYGFWDIMGSSGCKNLTYENSVLSRLDAHAGIYNARLKNSALWTIALGGGGNLEVEDCDVYCDSLIEMRADYGSNWKGKIHIKNLKLYNSSSATIFRCGWFNHDFGYPTYCPEEIIIDGLTLNKPCDIDIFPKAYVEKIANALLDEIDGKPNVNKTVPPKRIIIRNNKGGYKFILPDTDFFKNTELIIED